MRAAVYMGPGRIDVKDVETPRPGPGEILLKMRAAAICGTDVRIYLRGQANVVPPHITGHEICGEIAGLGAGVNGYEIGQRVTSVTSVGCGTCPACARSWTNMCPGARHIGYHFPGAFAESMVVPAPAVAQGAVLVAPEHLSDDAVALVEPLSCVINGQEPLHVGEGDTVVVIGMGPIGAMHLLLARASGAARTIAVDVEPRRLAMAKGFGPDKVIDGSAVDVVVEVQRLTDGRGADVVIVACGVRQAALQAVAMAAMKGRISFFAGFPKDDPTIALDANAVHYRELAIHGAFASHRTQFERAMWLAAEGKVDLDRLATQHFGLDRIVDAIETTRRGDGLKSIIRFD
ncbi:MAG: alcohol dehydrogenase catalytic domain-containing protein [Verrucomicrobia bacterium]|nr:alcohol dehydrogenase catalytic domain-containing protein [Verrucomicrobiota bacterium]